MGVVQGNLEARWQRRSRENRGGIDPDDVVQILGLVDNLA
jgi:hypothetical protein